MNYKSIADMNSDVLDWISYLPGDIDLVVGIPRSGMLVANLISLYMNIPLSNINSFVKGDVMEMGRYSSLIRKKGKSRNILIVDDSVLDGESIKEAKRKLKKLNNQYHFLFAALYASQYSTNKVDYYYQIVTTPRVFEWNLMRHDILKNACVDIDGVLCKDPTDSENDDSDKYIKFIKNVPTKIRPGMKIKNLVTCRLEKYRELTERWLGDNKIEFENLFMMNLPNKKIRQQLSNHAKFKADIYLKTNSKIFIESSFNQAVEIAKYSGKPVICLERSILISPNDTYELIKRTGDIIKIIKENLKSRIKKKIINISDNLSYQKFRKK